MDRAPAKLPTHRSNVVVHVTYVSPLLDPDDRILHALLGMVVADDDADPDELEMLSKVYAELTGQTLDPEQLAALATARLAPAAVVPSLDGLGDGLTPDDKHRVLNAAFSIAAADGFVLEEEDEQLAALAHALGLTGNAYRDAVQGLLSGGAR